MAAPATRDTLPQLFAACDRIHQLLRAFIQRQADPLASLDEGEDLQDLGPLPESLNRLCQRFALSPFERDILLLCAGMELAPDFEGLCLQAHQHPQRNYPTLALALMVLPGADVAVLSPESPLHRWQLVELGESHIFTQAPLRLHRRILCALLDQPGVDGALTGILQLWGASAQIRGADLVPSHQQVASQLAQIWQAAGDQPRPTLHLWGSDQDSQRAIAHQACGQMGWTLAEVDLGALPLTPQGRHRVAHQCWREGILGNAALALNGHTTVLESAALAQAIAQFTQIVPLPTVILSPDRLPASGQNPVVVAVPAPTPREQLALWQQHLSPLGVDLKGRVETLVAQFNLNAEAIRAACRHLQGQPQLLGDSEGTGLAPDRAFDCLWQFCRTQARPQLDDLAQRIDCHATWEDLVLAAEKKAVLRTLVTQTCHRSQVYHQWGFASKSDRGLGISALFAGQSGTGKTMAAEVIARELRLDLYRIDLSTVVSKYIGETEKNLRRIFDGAEGSGVVLLFDEADALFGKRTDVKDSHDRHANVEVSYLLQRMEAYRGLAIMTTNFKQAIDQAFIRRIRFIVSFPWPDAKAREEIWRRVFPAQTPLADLRYDRLANLNVAGGNIRAIAMNAAFLAAAAGEPLSMAHLLEATRQEYLKMERTLTKSETEGWLTPLSTRKKLASEPQVQWTRDRGYIPPEER
ncbi:MAG: ATP-binding protein [Leptolyngbya sp.]|nr:ATP-binding protein [Leptolyngbya sp.]